MGSWVKIGTRSRSKAEMDERAMRAARGLESLGVGPGDVIAIYMRNDFSFMEASLAAGLVGAYVVPVNWHNTIDEARYVFENSGAKVVVIHADLLRTVGKAIPAGVHVIVAEPSPELCTAYRISAEDAAVPAGMESWDAFIARFAPKEPPFPVSPGSMIYTSGTTGNPKGVRRQPATAEQAEASLGMMRTMAGLEGWNGDMSEWTLMIPGPAYHSSPNGWLFSFYNQGANIVVESRFDAERLLETVARERVTHLLAVPTMFVRLLALPDEVKRRYDLSSLHHVMHVGAPCAPHVKRGLIEWWGPVVSEHYGSTEVGAVTYCSAEEWLAHPGTVGRRLDGCDVIVVNEDGEEVGPGIPGEIVCGRELYPDFTYHGDDEKRRRSARGRLIATGDVGYFDEDGYLHLCGRASDMIIFGGTNVYPAEIEAELLKVPGVYDCAVFGIPDEEFGEQVCAFVQPSPGSDLTADTIRADLKARLAGYKIPKRIEFSETLPREDTGKIFKRKLREPFWQGAGRAI